MRRARVHLSITAAVIIVVIAAACLVLFMRPQCLVLTDGGGHVLAAYPLENGDIFSVEFIHSVNKTPVRDVFTVAPGTIRAVETVYYGFGAGMEAELTGDETLTYDADGAMHITGFDKTFTRLSYVVSPVSGHTLVLWPDTPDAKTVSLETLCGRGKSVTLTVRREFARVR